MRPRTGALPTRLLSPTHWIDRRNIYPPHFSALHFSAIPSFVSFRFFRLSAKKNQLSVLSVSRKKEKKTKKSSPFLFLCGSGVGYPKTGVLSGEGKRTTFNAQRATYNVQLSALNFFLITGPHRRICASSMPTGSEQNRDQTSKRTARTSGQWSSDLKSTRPYVQNSNVALHCSIFLQLNSGLSRPTQPSCKTGSPKRSNCLPSFWTGSIVCATSRAFNW